MNAGEEFVYRNSEDGFIRESNGERWYRNSSFMPGYLSGIPMSNQSRQFKLGEAASSSMSSKVTGDSLVGH
jgi:hypothetical protein